MNDCEIRNSKPVVHWVSAALSPEERIEVEMLKLEFVMQMYDSLEGFLSQYDKNPSGCVVLCRDFLDQEISYFFNQISVRNQLAKVILYLSSLNVPDAVRAIKLGFADALQMPSGLERIRNSLQEAVECDQTKRAACRVDIPQDILSLLNPEETRIFQCLAEGVANKQISAELGLSIRTIHYRKKIIFEKLRIGNRTEAIELLRTLRNGKRAYNPTIIGTTCVYGSNPSSLITLP